jgi:6-phosphogluconolactonase
MQWIEKSNLPELLQALGQDWMQQTQTLMASHGQVAWLLSGGNTPKPFYEWLSAQALPWNNLQLFLVDERMVPPHDVHSNERMVREAFGSRLNNGCQLLSMVTDLSDLDANLTRTTATYALLQEIPFLCLLGMGLDGHTASLFPHDSQTEAGLMLKSPGLLYTQAPNPPHQRITTGVSLLSKATKTYVLFTGDEKRGVWMNAGKMGLPVARVLQHVPNGAVYFTP